MGIIIIPFLLLSFVSFLITLFVVFKMIKNREIDSENYFLGFLITIILYFIIYFNYKICDSAIALGTYFVFPFFMIGIPFVFGLFLKTTKNMKLKKLMQSLLISVISSSLFIVIFNNYTFGLIETLGLRKIY